jgi:K(+)-stimulated pyrophosphate-energized sodium pump
MSIGDKQHDGVRIVIALVAVAIIAVAVYIAKRRPIAIGGDDDAVPSANEPTPASHG